MGDDFYIEIEAEGKGHFICDRCGESYQKSVSGGLKTFYTFDSARAQEGEDSEVNLLSHSAQEIDITRDSLDALLLAVPSKRLCSSDCRGLCPRCGANLNETSCSCRKEDEDSRWEALKGIRFDD